MESALSATFEQGKGLHAKENSGTLISPAISPFAQLVSLGNAVASLSNQSMQGGVRRAQNYADPLQISINCFMMRLIKGCQQRNSSWLMKLYAVYCMNTVRLLKVRSQLLNHKRIIKYIANVMCARNQLECKLSGIPQLSEL